MLHARPPMPSRTHGETQAPVIGIGHQHDNAVLGDAESDEGHHYRLRHFKVSTPGHHTLDEIGCEEAVLPGVTGVAVQDRQVALQLLATLEITEAEVLHILRSGKRTERQRQHHQHDAKQKPLEREESHHARHRVE